MFKLRKFTALTVVVLLFSQVLSVESGAATCTTSSHTYTTASTRAADCTQPGGTTYVCTKCGSTKFTSTSAALGHSYHSKYKICQRYTTCGYVSGIEFHYMFRKGNFANTISHGYPTYKNSTKAHNGMDIISSTSGAVNNMPIYSATSGTVLKSEYSNSYGNYVVIKNSKYQVYYAHLNTLNVSKEGTVTEKTMLGRVGSTGNSDGAHLHFEIRSSSGSTIYNPVKCYPSSVYDNQDMYK